MLLENKKIAIIGAGPGGLTLAKLLQQQKIDVHVYERDIDKNARVQGSPLDLHENSVLEALQKMNLLDEFKKNFIPGADKTQIMNPNAEVLFSDHEYKVLENFNNPYFRPEIDRGVLRKILLESLTAETVIWDSHFISIKPENKGWQLCFKNGKTAYADLVIAADGANSKIRPYLTNIKAVYTGVTMLEGTIYNAQENAPAIHSLLKGGKIMAFGNNKNILLGQKANGEIGFYASLRTNENWSSNNGLDYTNNNQMLDWFHATYPEWDKVWEELFTSAASFIPRPIYCMPLKQEWKTQTNITLLGDAAHLMPPFAGEGVNMAMLDALQLSKNLLSNTFASVQDALADYEHKMLKRTSKIAKESLENGEKMHASNSLETMLNFFKGH